MFDVIEMKLDKQRQSTACVDNKENYIVKRTNA